MVYVIIHSFLVFVLDFCRIFVSDFVINSFFFRIELASNFERSEHKERAFDVCSLRKGGRGMADSRNCWMMVAGCRDDARNHLYREDNRAGSSEGNGGY